MCFAGVVGAKSRGERVGRRYAVPLGRQAWLFPAASTGCLPVDADIEDADSVITTLQQKKLVNFFLN